MTVFEKLKQIEYDDLVEKLYEVSSDIGETPWDIWFDKIYCSKCSNILCSSGNIRSMFPCSWCELNHKCFFFQDLNQIPNDKEVIGMWLNSEAE